MSDVWQAFGIKSLSPSQLSKWGACRGQWYASARAKVYEDAGPAAWRGDAVEAGLYSALTGNGAPHMIAAQTFEHREMEYAKAHDGELHPDGDEERALITPALDRAIAAWEAEGLSKPEGYQVRAEGFLPGCGVQIFGKPDFAIKSPSAFCVDLKTTGQLPSQPKDGRNPEAKTDHAIAASIYAHLRGEERAAILYVSTAGNPKDKHRLIKLEPEDVSFYVQAATQAVAQIEATLTAALAWSEFEIIAPEQALAKLCRPSLLARGGGTYPIWRREYIERALLAVPAWQ